MQLNRRTLVAMTAAAALAPSRAMGASELERPDLAEVFAGHGVEGAFVALDVVRDTLTLVGGGLARRRLIPASTFKIPNSLIALETGVIKDENEIVPYGGKPQPLKQWERDMSIREAIVVSNVPIYQELARRIGLLRYREWLNRLDYGNRQTGDDVERFWLKGPLETTPIEQALFLARLARGKLDASPRAQAIVRDIVKLEAMGGATLYGKSGFTTASTPSTGWWVGWVENGASLHSFAVVLMGLTMADAGKRLTVGRALLQRLGIYAAG